MPFSHLHSLESDVFNMKNRLAISTSVLALVVALACNSQTIEYTSYGDALTLSDTTLVSQILAAPDSYIGERVLITGTIVEVCEMKGCWLEVASDAEFEKIRVKVDDGVIVFPLSARGHTAIVEGVVELLELTEEQAIEQAKHHAEEQGVEFDPSTVTGPQTSYQIRGLGALIAE